MRRCRASAMGQSGRAGLSKALLVVLASTALACNTAQPRDIEVSPEGERICSLVTSDEVEQLFGTDAFDVAFKGPFENATSTNGFCVFTEPEDDRRLSVFLGFNSMPDDAPPPTPNGCTPTEEPLRDFVLRELDCPPGLLRLSLTRRTPEGLDTISASLEDPELPEPAKQLLRDLAPRMLERAGV